MLHAKLQISPTRSSLQSGRLPTHVNTENLGTNVWNPADPVSGFSAIPRNMTGLPFVIDMFLYVYMFD